MPDYSEFDAMLQRGSEGGLGPRLQAEPGADEGQEPRDGHRHCRTTLRSLRCALMCNGYVRLQHGDCANMGMRGSCSMYSLPRRASAC